MTENSKTFEITSQRLLEIKMELISKLADGTFYQKKSDEEYKVLVDEVYRQLQGIDPELNLKPVPVYVVGSAKSAMALRVHIGGDTVVMPVPLFSTIWKEIRSNDADEEISQFCSVLEFSSEFETPLDEVENMELINLGFRPDAKQEYISLNGTEGQISDFDTYLLSVASVDQYMPNVAPEDIEFMQECVTSIYDWHLTESYAIIVRPPQSINVNPEDHTQYHNTEGPAVTWANGTKTYMVSNIQVEKSLFESIENKTFTFDDLVTIQNEEIKAAVLQIITGLHGEEGLFKFLSAQLEEKDTYVDYKDPKYLVGTTGSMTVGTYTLFQGRTEAFGKLSFVRCYCPSTDRMFFLCTDPDASNAKDAIAFLYRIPRVMKPFLTAIRRQGEMFSSFFNEEGSEKLKTLTPSEVSDTVTITGDEYFSLIQFEY